MITHHQPKPTAALFKVIFVGGTSVTLSAPNSLKAECKAQRQHPGVVKQVKFLRRTNP